ncbi:hypothetical protein [Natranaeroarchaeum aerophilus]|uniref:Uncharacterized protein n=1 Tax=Natranaeroarchaeum aerophilus TaxID=2917711 RepID=A0AAE3FUC1_9EURY|nr:hypothetical protein [Natranaeroarchaeum aerophilus]MCL9814729.1 hypothetical protein [Natranaeroarchaeum aerophilus]
MTWASDSTRFLVLLAVGAVCYAVAAVAFDEFTHPIELAIFVLGLAAVLGLFWYYADELRE